MVVMAVQWSQTTLRTFDHVLQYQYQGSPELEAGCVGIPEALLAY